jgi:4,5-DOPA dioxygenase extradiol
MPQRMPVLFVGHGNPMNAITSNVYTKAWAEMGRTMPRPKAILAVSAHWYLPETAVTINAKPETIHDFGGFPQELYQVQYHAPGSPELAQHVKDALAPLDVKLDGNWGLDHGTWSVLKHMYPEADIPVVQLSIHEMKPPQYHYDIGKKLASLREEGVLIVGSGNLVHNLHAYAWGRDAAPPYDWAIRFETRVKELLLAGDAAGLVEFKKMGRDAILSIPTPDHYLPFLYVVGARRDKENISFPVEGIDGGSVSMLACRIG